jgi:hypothetical protein
MKVAPIHTQRIGSILAALTVATAGMLLLAAPAFAVSKHIFTTSFAGSGASALSNPSDVDVDQSSGDVYVTDPANFRVEKFTASGEFILMFGKEVNKEKVEEGRPVAEQNVCDAGEECQAGTQGTSPGAFKSTVVFRDGKKQSRLFLAVDNSGGPSVGDVYVGDPADSLVSKFDPEGRLISSWGVGGQLDGSNAEVESFQSPNLSDHLGLFGIAVDPAGNLFATGGLNWEFEFDPAGSFITQFPFREDIKGLAVDRGGNSYQIIGGSVVKNEQRNYMIGVLPGEPGAAGLRLDPVTAELYAPIEDGTVAHLPASCEAVLEISGPPTTCAPLETFGAGHLSEPNGVAVDHATGTVYIANTGEHDVAVFGAVPYLPDTTASAQPHTPTSENLSGSADPAAAGPITACGFEYVRFANEVQTVTLEAASGSGDLTVSSKQVTGLSTASGTFAPGEAIAGAGIPAGTTVAAVSATTLTLSKPATASGAAVWLSAKPSGGTFALTFEGRTTPPLSPDMSSSEVRSILQQSFSIRVAVTGPAAGPYRVEFGGFLAHTDVPQLLADSSSLTPAGAMASVATVTPGSGDWSAAATATCEPDPASGPDFESPTDVTAQLSGLEHGASYRYRLRAADANGSSANYTQLFTTVPLAPQIAAEAVSSFHADAATAEAQIDPGGGEAEFHTFYLVEYLTAGQVQRNKEEGADEFAGASRTASRDAGSARAPTGVTVPLSRLEPGTIYRYRFVAENAGGSATGLVRSFATLPFVNEFNDVCANAHVRQQTSAAQLLDCRAYELVSAADTAGYDVESSLIPGQSPFASYPDAQGRVLYGVHNGGIPGTGNPTNRGLDPYLALRGAEGWSTTYVGIPANINGKTAPFSSTLGEADAGLDTFAFAGPELCAPCFTKKGAIETGIPLHLPSGELIQGMAGPVKPEPTATPDGHIGQYLSANGEHLVFGSTSRFAEGGNEGTGDVSIYDRNLATGKTRVVSNGPTTEDFPVPLPCLQGAGQCHSPADPNGIAELGISANGSRILLAQKVSEDADHNPYWHLYMEVNDSISSIDLTPGVIAEPGGGGFDEGVLFAGMSVDGSKVFLTTSDKLLPEDTDSSPDLYVAEVSGTGSTLHLISTGSAETGNSDACEPIANENGEHWNALGATGNCGVLAIGGGGGVASAADSAYFLSPEQLTSCDCAEPLLDPVQNQPNLYVAAPGKALRFVATLEVNNPMVLDALREAGTRRSADFQLTPSGHYAAFPSVLDLTGGEVKLEDHTVLYRYDASAGSLACVSCTPTGAPSDGDSGLASTGSSLSADGRVFFDSTDQLAVSDSDGVGDVYEWEPLATGNCQGSSPSFAKAENACLALISAGTSSVASGLHGVSADGSDAYFFTRDSLAPQDKNGPTMKIYDARVGGGFPYLFPPSDCKASDECHGAASPLPGPLPIGSESGTEHNYQRCKRGYVRRHGRCVKKHRHHRTHRKRAHHHRRRGAR